MAEKKRKQRGKRRSAPQPLTVTVAEIIGEEKAREIKRAGK